MIWTFDDVNNERLISKREIVSLPDKKELLEKMKNICKKQVKTVGTREIVYSGIRYSMDEIPPEVEEQFLMNAPEHDGREITSTAHHGVNKDGVEVYHCSVFWVSYYKYLRSETTKLILDVNKNKLDNVDLSLFLGEVAAFNTNMFNICHLEAMGYGCRMEEKYLDYCGLLELLRYTKLELVKKYKISERSKKLTEMQQIFPVAQRNAIILNHIPCWNR